MDELRERVQGATIFSKIDLKSGFNLIRIRAGDEWKSAFRTRYRHFEYLVMPFAMANAPATFQNMINPIFRDLLDRGLVIYMDDMMMYSAEIEEHRELMLEVLRRLKENNLTAAVDKCYFHKREIEFLGHTISANGVEMWDDKIETILVWKRPENVKDVQRFMGFANFYRRFIQDFSITDLMKKEKRWDWTPQCETAFET